ILLCLCAYVLFCCVIRCALSSTLFPYTTLFRSLLLRRRTSPLGNLLGAEASQTISFGRAVAVPDGPQFLRVKIRKTLFGKLLPRDRKSTRLNSSHVAISYAVFCLKKKICINENP